MVESTFVHFCQCVADISDGNAVRPSFFFLAVSVRTDYSFKRFEDNCEMQKSHSCFDLMRCDRIKSGEKSGNIGVMPGEA